MPLPPHLRSTACASYCAAQEIGLFIEHCALDHGAIFMDSAIEQIKYDVIEAVADDDEWNDTPPAAAGHGEVRHAAEAEAHAAEEVVAKMR